VVGGQPLRSAEAQVAQGQVDRPVPLLPHQDADARRPAPPLRGAAPAPPPAPPSTRPGAAARQVKLAIVAPVANPTAEPAGSPSSCSSQRAATSSTATTPGGASRMPPSRSPAVTS